MLFGMKKSKELEVVLTSLRMNLANNYKDNTQADFRKYSEMLGEFKADGKLTAKQEAYYDRLLEEYGAQLRNYTHAKQKTTWTKEDM